VYHFSIPFPYTKSSKRGIFAMEETRESKSSEEIQRVSEGRRKLLKVLAVSGGTIVAATLLPEEWVKPVIDWGVLPTHAQVSPGPVVISNLVVSFLGPAVPDAEAKPEVVILPPMPPTPLLYEAGFDYHDSKSRVDDTSILYATLNQCGALPFSGGPLASLISTMVGIAVWTGDSTSGRITFRFTANSCGSLDSQIMIQFKVKGDLSNQLLGAVGSMMSSM
jgi:hypothetical protein